MKRYLSIGFGMGIGLLASVVHAEVIPPIEFNFESGQSQVTTDTTQDEHIAAAAREMNNFPYANIVVEGYADSDGMETSNDTLSADRANAVKELFSHKYGVDPSRIFVAAHGEKQAVA